MLTFITGPSITVPDWLLALTGLLVVGTAIGATIYRMNRTVSIIAYGQRKYDDGYLDAEDDLHDYAHDRYDAGYEDGLADRVNIGRRHIAEREQWVRDTWLHDELAKLQAWSDREQAKARRAHGRILSSAPRATAPMPLLELEAVAP